MIEAQLRSEVRTLLSLAEKTDRAGVPDGMDVPSEIARREDRLAAIAQAKAKIEQRAAERHQVEQQEFEAKQAKREAQRDAGKKPRGKDSEPPEAAHMGSDQVNLTDEASRILPGSGGSFEQSYNGPGRGRHADDVGGRCVRHAGEQRQAPSRVGAR